MLIASCLEESNVKQINNVQCVYGMVTCVKVVMKHMGDPKIIAMSLAELKPGISCIYICIYIYI